MLDFAAVRNRTKTLAELTEGLSMAPAAPWSGNRSEMTYAPPLFF